MPTFQLSNTASQLNQTISEHYTRLIANYVGPLTAGSSSSLFCIQNGSKGLGITVSTDCVNFYANNLNFNNVSADLRVCIPANRNFIITGNGAIMDFHANGTFSVGQDVDLNYKGLQVFNSCPGILLKDSDAINGSGCQFIRFIDSTGYNQALISYDRVSVGCYPTNNSYNSLNIYNRCIFRILNHCQTTLVSKDDKVTILAGDNIDPNWNIHLGKSTYIAAPTTISGALCVCSSIESKSSSNFQWECGQVGTINTSYCPISANQFIQYNNLYNVGHTRINARQNHESNTYNSILDFYITPKTSDFSFGGMDPRCVPRQQLAMSLTSNTFGERKLEVYGNFCAFDACVSNLYVNNIRNGGSITYINGPVHSFDSLNANSTDISLNRNKAYCMRFASSIIRDHTWNVVTTSTCLNCPLTYSSFGLISSFPITTACGFVSSGNLVVCNSNGKSCILQNEICLVANSQTQSGIFICGNTTVRGNIFHSGVLNTSGICSVSNSVFNCFNSCVYAPLVSTCSSYISGSANSSSIGIYTSNAICANSLLSNSCVCGSTFCQNSTNTNCFCGSINVGADCNLFVRSKNTPKAWGTACIINGWVANNAVMNSYYNINNIIHNNFNSANAVYVLSLTDPIKAPISANFSVKLPFVGYPYSTGASVYDSSSYLTKFSSGLMPVTVNLINYGKNVSNGTCEYLVDGNCYNCLFFTMTNECLLKTFWNNTWGDVTTNLPDKTCVSLRLAGTFQGTMSNYLKAIIDFSIYGS